MFFSKRECVFGKENDKSAAFPRGTFYRNVSFAQINNPLHKGKSQPISFCSAGGISLIKFFKNMCFCTSSVIPLPSSEIETATVSEVSQIAIWMLLPADECLIALSIRLIQTCSKREALL